MNKIIIDMSELNNREAFTEVEVRMPNGEIIIFPKTIFDANYEVCYNNIHAKDSYNNIIATYATNKIQEIKGDFKFQPFITSDNVLYKIIKEVKG